MALGKIISRTLLAGVFIVVVHTVAYPAGDDYFREQNFEIPGVILGFQTADFDGDGRIDIALITSESPANRVAQVFLQRESDRFPPTVSQRFELPSTVNMFQAADLDGDERAEIYIIDRDGLRQYKHDGTKFSPTAKAAAPGLTLFAGGIEGAVLPDKFIYEISGNLVAFVPVAHGFILWEYRNGKFTQFDAIEFPHVVYKGERSVKYFGNASPMFVMKLPQIRISPRGDKSEIYLLWPDRLAIFAPGEDGKFADETPSHFHFQQSLPGNFCQSRLADFDLDNRLDLICSQSKGGISGALTEINFFGSDRLRSPDAGATHTINLTDACGNLLLDNFDRQGGIELAVPAVELGTMSTVKMMITKKTDLHILIYPIDNLGRPSPEPAVRRKMTCRLDFDKANPVEDVRVNWSGDYDGDGLPDLALADGGGQLMFFRGSAEEYLENKAERMLSLVDPDIIQPVDFNADGRSDLIIVHQPDKAGTRLTLFITSRIM